MNLQNQMNLQQNFEAAVTRVNALPGDQAAAHMNELYGLYKQATEGDHDAKDNEVGDDTPDMPNGVRDLSQAQWDSWSKYKGVSQDEARQKYIEKVNEIAGPTDHTTPANEAPAPGTAKAENGSGEGISMGGLRGNINAGAPYGGEDELKTEQ